ncbi:MAG TPA: MFS transporter [Planctomycetota bacterium]|nr:MFS transporter [Planctomycetota bacterium]
MREKFRKVLSSVAGRHWIVILAMVKSAAGGMLAVGLPVKLDRLGWSDWDLGLFAAVGATTYTVVCWVYSLLLHKVPLQRMMSVAAAVAGAAAIGLWAVPFRLPLFLLGAGFWFASAFFWPSLMAWIGESDEAHLVGDMSAFNCAWTISSTAGFVVGGIVESLVGGLSLVLVAAVLGLLALAAPFAHIRGRGAFPATVASPPATPVLPRRFLTAGWLAAILVTLAIAVPGAIFVKLNSALGYSPRDFGILLGLQGGAQAFVFLALGVLQGWRYRRWPLVAPLVLSAAGSALLFFPFGGGAFGWHTLALGFVLLGAGMGLGYGAGFYYTVACGRSRRRSIGFFEAVVSAQHVVGGVLGGSAATLLWRRAPYAVVAALAALGVAIQGSLLRGVSGPAEPAGGPAPDKPANETPR